MWPRSSTRRVQNGNFAVAEQFSKQFWALAPVEWAWIAINNVAIENTPHAGFKRGLATTHHDHAPSGPKPDPLSSSLPPSLLFHRSAGVRWYSMVEQSHWNTGLGQLWSLANDCRIAVRFGVLRGQGSESRRNVRKKPLIEDKYLLLQPGASRPEILEEKP